MLACFVGITGGYTYLDYPYAQLLVLIMITYYAFFYKEVLKLLCFFRNFNMLWTSLSFLGLVSCWKFEFKKEMHFADYDDLIHFILKIVHPFNLSLSIVSASLTLLSVLRYYHLNTSVLNVHPPFFKQLYLN